MKLNWSRRESWGFTRHTAHRLFWLALAALALGIFVKVTWELKEDSDLNSLDQFILTWVSQHRVHWLNGPAVDVTALGSPTLATLISTITLIILIQIKDRTAAIHLLIASVGAGLLSSLFKQLIGRVRPTVVNPLVEVTGYSYPSGHSLAAAAIYMTLAILASRHFSLLRPKLVLFLIALFGIGLVGASRVYLGVHYPSDVISGTFLGMSWALFLASYFSSRYWRQSDGDSFRMR